MHLTPEDREIGKDNYHEVIGSLDSRRDFLKQAVAAAAVPAVGAASMGSTYFDYGAADTMKDKVRVGVIGTGDEGCVLMGAINPDYVQVVAIADIRPYNIFRAFHGDHSSPNALKVRPGLMKKYGWDTDEEARKNVAVYDQNYEELLDDPNVEAVIIALPLHLHDQAAIKAMRKKKHVLTEKLMGHSVHQCKEMSRVSEQTGLLLATGHQRHYSVLYDNAVDMIHQGLLGDLHHIRAQWHRGNMPGKDSWQQPLPFSPDENTKAFQETLSEVVKFQGTAEERKKVEQRVIKAYRDALSGVARAGRASGGSAGQKSAETKFKQMHKILASINSWTGSRDKARKASDIEKYTNLVNQGYHRMADMLIEPADYDYHGKTLEDGTKISPLEELIRWRLWDRTGGGLMAELGSHQLDAASIFIKAGREDGKKVQPLSVLAVGGRHIFPYDRDVDDHVYCMFEFPGEGYYSDIEKRTINDPNKKIVVTYSSINGNGYGGHGEIVFGTKGTLMLEREKDAILLPGSSATRVKVAKKSNDTVTLDTTESGPSPAAALSKAAASGPVSRGYTEEIEHWAWCIRNPSEDPKNQPKCGPAVALADAAIALTANIAMKENRRIEFKPEWFDIESDETPEGKKPKKADDLG